MNSKVRTGITAIAGLAALCSTALIDIAQAAAQTFTGSTERNPRGGSVQVQITVDNGKITAITTPVQPGGGNQAYSSYAIPTLTTRALAAQSATIQGVSGASQISTAWKASLANAISKAGSAITGGSGTPATSAPAPVQTQSTQTQPNTGSGTTAGNTGARLPRSGHVENHGYRGGEGGEGGEHEGFEGNEEGDDDGAIIIRPRVVPTPKTSIAPAPVVTPKAATVIPAPTQSAAQNTQNSLGLVPRAGVIQKSITCVKGATKKVVKGTNPKCPTGYTLKKP